jgi:hypothetical protein
MTELIHVCTSWPTLAVTTLLGLVVLYWLCVILGALDFDLFDFDVDLDGHPDSFLDWGMVGLKWFNLGEVPLMVWLSAFALPAWLASVSLNRDLVDPTTPQIVAAILRDVGIGLFAAKVLTWPIKGKLKTREPNPAAELIGRFCEITTSEATAEFGQARYDTDGAPLLLNVRSVGAPVPKGLKAQIVDYSAEQHVYYVQPVQQT